MDFELSESQEIFRDSVRKFARREIEPLVKEAERKAEFPYELFLRSGSLGYLGVRYPEEYGGGGMGHIGSVIFLEEVARVSFGISVGLGNSVGSANLIYSFGNEEQKQKYLVPVVKGEKVSAFGLTEPNAGSDAAAMETTAVREGNRFILNGNKIYITNGTICDFVITAAYTDKSQGGAGVSIFIVDKDCCGFSRKKMDKFCAHSSETAELYYDDCEVPAENLIGEAGMGFKYLMKTLTGSRITHAARSVGLAQAAFEASLSYAKERQQFGQSISSFQAIAFKLARMATLIESSRWLTYRAAWLSDQGKECLKEAAMAKLFASEACVYTSEEAMQIHGGVALMSESPIARYFADSRFNTITDGTSEVQQIIIARQLGVKVR